MNRTETKQKQKNIKIQKTKNKQKNTDRAVVTIKLHAGFLKHNLLLLKAKLSLVQVNNLEREISCSEY